MCSPEWTEIQRHTSAMQGPKSKTGPNEHRQEGGNRSSRSSQPKPLNTEAKWSSVLTLLARSQARTQVRHKLQIKSPAPRLKVTGRVTIQEARWRPLGGHWAGVITEASRALRYQVAKRRNKQNKSSLPLIH